MGPRHACHATASRPDHQAATTTSERGAFLASDQSAYISGQTIASCDGGTFARVSIYFPTDLGQSDDITSGSIPDGLRAQIDR